MLGLLGEAFLEAGALNDKSTKASTSSAESISPQLNPLGEVSEEAVAEDWEVKEGLRGLAAAGDAAEEAADDARRPTMRGAPVEPTTREIAERNLTHLPLSRSWRPCCVAAKAKQWPHRKPTL